MADTRAEHGSPNDRASNQASGEPDLKEYHQQRLVDAALALQESCYLTKDNPLSRTEVLRQVDQLKKDGGLNSDFLSQKDAAELFKGSKTDSKGNITELRFQSCTLPFSDTKVSITPAGAKINGKNHTESLKEEDKLIVDFAAASIDNPLKSYSDFDSKKVTYAPELSTENKTLAKQGLEALLSSDSSKLSAFAKAILSDPKQGENVLAGIHWNQPDIPVSMQALPSGESVLNVGSDFLGKFQLDSQGHEKFFPSTMFLNRTESASLNEIADKTRERMASDYMMAMFFYEKTSKLPVMLIRPNPKTLADGYHQLFEKQAGK